MSLPSGTFTPQNPFLFSYLFSYVNSNQTQEISQFGEQNVVKETVGLDLGKSSNKKQKKLRSDVWDNFEKYTDENGKEWAICNICKVKKDGSSKQGTTHLRNHFNSCRKNKKNEGGGSASGDKPAENSNQKQEISQIGEQNVVKEMVGLDLGKSSNKKQKKLRSKVWDNFVKYTDENGKEWAICNICKVKKDGSSKQGTTHLRNHFNSCNKNKKNEGGGSASGDKRAENDDMQHLFIFNMGGQGQGQGSSNATKYGHPYPFMSNPSPNYSFDDEPSRSSGKAVVRWVKIKAAMRFCIFVRNKAAERRAGVHDLLSRGIFNGSASGDTLAESDDMQHLFIFNMGGRGQGQGSSNATKYGYPYPFMSNPSPNYSFDDEPSRSSGKAVVRWVKIKAAMRFCIFIRNKAAERRAGVHDLLSRAIFNGSASGDKRAENDDMQHLFIFNMGGRGQGQGSSNATKYGYPYPFMSNPSSNYSFDDVPSRSSGKAGVRWVKIKAAMRFCIFIKNKAAERRAGVHDLLSRGMFNGSASGDKRAENDDMQHLFIFNMGGRGQGQGSNATKYGYPYPFMSNPSSNYSFDDVPSRSSGKAVVRWVKIKAAMRFCIFIKNKAAERRAGVHDLLSRAIFNGSASGDKRAENDDMQHLFIFNMGGRGQGQGSNATKYGYPYPFMSNPSPNYSFDDVSSRSSGKAVVRWVKVKAAMRFCIFIRNKAAERRAGVHDLLSRGMFNGSASGDKQTENDDMHHLFNFNMGGRGQGQGSSNATKYGYPYPFMSYPTPNYSFDDVPSRSSGKAVVRWVKIKAAMRFCIFVRNKAAERRAGVHDLLSRGIFNGSASGDKRAENDDMQHLFIFNMGGRGQGQGSNATKYGYPYPFMSNPSPNYSFDDVLSRSLGKAVVRWVKIKAAMRFCIFIRKKAAERRAGVHNLLSRGMFNGSASGDKRAENDDMQHLFIFNMGGRGQGQGFSNATKYGYPYPFMSNPSPNYSFDDVPSRSSGKAIVRWVKIKAAMRFCIFIRNKAAERRAGVHDLLSRGMFNGSASGDKQAENDDMHHLFIFNMGGRGQGQGSSNATKYGYPYPFMSYPTPNYSFDDVPSRSSGKAVVRWVKIKAAMRFCILIRNKAAERRAGVHDLLSRGMFNGSASGDKRAENDDVQHLFILNMGGRGQGQGSSNATKYGYPYSRPFMSNPSPNYSFDDEPSHSSGKAVVGWPKIKGQGCHEIVYIY
ncbi:hypothetical protein QYF36_004921 [Acer negundo]|nr:hypothetical protein QYF36_004921 [Acer negundo]